MKEIRLRLALWLLKPFYYVIMGVGRDRQEDVEGGLFGRDAFCQAKISCSSQGEQNEIMQVLKTMVEEKVPLRGLILNLAINYLKDYEVDRKTFIQNLYDLTEE